MKSNIHKSGFVYGIFNGDTCVYIGQTCVPGLRREQHRRKFPNGEFRILRESFDAIKDERELIREYLDKGHPLINKGCLDRSSVINIRCKSAHKAEWVKAAGGKRKLSAWVVKTLNDLAEAEESSYQSKLRGLDCPLL